MYYTKEDVKNMDEAQKRKLAMDNSWSTAYEKCSNCGVYKETRYICWNCDYDSSD